jgi:predicted murein hydrolase (TIGR00659 family)
MEARMIELRGIWVYLSTSPLLHLTMTLAAYAIGYSIYRWRNFNPLFNPVLIAVGLVVTALLLTQTSYQTYFQGAQFVHFLLGPATVALAVPLYRQAERVRRSALAIFASIIAGSLTAAISAVAVVWALGGNRDSIISIAPKSVTAPVAMAIVEQLGGLPSLTAALVILTGITGAMLGPPLMNRMGIRDWAARGLAMGVASHGIGTARALQVNELAGAFAGLAMGLNAMATSILVPALWHLISGS